MSAAGAELNALERAAQRDQVARARIERCPELELVPPSEAKPRRVRRAASRLPRAPRLVSPPKPRPSPTIRRDGLQSAAISPLAASIAGLAAAAYLEQAEPELELVPAAIRARAERLLRVIPVESIGRVAQAVAVATVLVGVSWDDGE